MSMLTEQEYEEYIRLLRAWVEAEKALEGPDRADSEAAHHAREAHSAVQGFRERHGLGETAEAERVAAETVYSRRRRQAEA